MSGVMRTFCISGCPPEPEPFPLSSWPRFPLLAPPDAPPKPEPKVEPLREPKLLPAWDDDVAPPALLLPLLELLLLSERRSPTLDAPEPGAIWLSALSSKLVDDPPPNMSVSTRAICFASPYLIL